MSSDYAIEMLYAHYLQSRSVTIDSRNVTAGALFFALKGPNFNGNMFAEEALAHGAAFAVIDDVQYKKDERYIVVDDALATLQMLAVYHRRQLNIPIIGITGSSGKTTTKELISAVLGTCYTTWATQGNLNNHIGVPLTVLGIGPDVDIAVVEMGANHIGEIASLCKIAMPTHGLIVNVGHVHIEGFGSFQGVIKGKSELYNYLRSNDGVIFVNSKDDILYDLVNDFSNIVTYPQENDFYHCKFLEENPFVVCQDIHLTKITSQLLGRYHFNNIAAALCIGMYFQVDHLNAQQAIQAYRPSNNRSQIVKKGSNTIFLDAYNSNPNSVKGAISTFNLMNADDKVLILGDMQELGSESKLGHQEIVKLTKKEPYKQVLLCGPLMMAARKFNTEALFFSDKKSLNTFLKQKKFEKTSFLIKGSRSLQLETLIENI